MEGIGKGIFLLLDPKKVEIHECFQFPYIAGQEVFFFMFTSSQVYNNKLMV